MHFSEFVHVESGVSVLTDVTMRPFFHIHLFSHEEEVAWLRLF
jgi:hypothetical protein